ncbi:MAG: hypothetical protein B6I17_04665, partial [Tenericutes bacterium 4572_104]
PNIPTPLTAYAYLATCIFEGTNLSEGRGTTKPFFIIGSPYLDSEFVIEEIKKYSLAGIKFRTIYFTPKFSKYKDELCQGIELIITDYINFKPVKTGFILLDIIRKHHKEFSYIEPFTKDGRPFIDLLSGDVLLRENKLGIEEIIDKMEKDSLSFLKVKRRYHIYD